MGKTASDNYLELYLYSFGMIERTFELALLARAANFFGRGVDQRC